MVIVTSHTYDYTECAAITSVALFANTFKTALCVDTLSIHVAVVSGVGTFVNICGTVRRQLVIVCISGL